MAPVLSPFERAFAWHVPGPRLDVEAMARGGRAARWARMISRRFRPRAAETRRRADACSRSIVRESRERASRSIAYEVTGDGFLRHMVRAIVGTLVEVGRGRDPAEWISEVLRRRIVRAAAAPRRPQGCFWWASSPATRS